MANTAAPFGLRPVRHVAGGEIRSNKYPILASYATPIYKGSIVAIVAGYLKLSVSGTTVNNIGVFDGVSYTDATGKTVFTNFWPGAITGATNIEAIVYDDPFIIYQAQIDVGDLTQAKIGGQVDPATQTGSSSTGLSTTALNTGAALAGITATGGALRIMRLVNDGVNEMGAYALLEVTFAEHVLNGVVAGVGGA